MMAKTMKPRVMWAIVNRKTQELADGQVVYLNVPLLFEREAWARAEVGKLGRVAKVEIREIR